MQGSFTLHDIVVKIFHPPLSLSKKLYLSLVESLSDYYTTHSMSSDRFSFSSSPQRITTVTPQMSSVMEVFDGSKEEVCGQVFKILNQVVVASQTKRIDYFDLILSAVYTMPQVSEVFYFTPVDYLGKCFLKPGDWYIPEAENCTTGIQWFFQRGQKNYTLRLEPLKGRNDSIFVDMVVMFPQESISLAEMKALVEEEFGYFTDKIFPFITNQLRMTGM